MERVAADPWARRRVMFDIVNEPDAQFLHVSRLLYVSLLTTVAQCGNAFSDLPLCTCRLPSPTVDNTLHGRWCVFRAFHIPRLVSVQWVPYTNRSGTYVPAIREVYHTIMKRGFEINPGQCTPASWLCDNLASCTGCTAVTTEAHAPMWLVGVDPWPTADHLTFHGLCQQIGEIAQSLQIFPM